MTDGPRANASSNGALLSIRDLHVGFRSGGAVRNVVHGASLELHENETLGLGD